VILRYCKTEYSRNAESWSGHDPDGLNDTYAFIEFSRLGMNPKKAKVLFFISSRKTGTSYRKLQCMQISSQHTLYMKRKCVYLSYFLAIKKHRKATGTYEFRQN
jgi:hypothetical protein